jgi:putative membrane protein
MIKSFLTRFLAVVVAILILPRIVPGISVEVSIDALIAAAVLGLLNIFLKPIIRFASLPLRVLTLGLFSLVINGVILWIAGRVVDGFTIAKPLDAFFGALIISAVSFLTRALMTRKKH